MTKEEKELLLKDLGARLQYKLHCRVFKLNEDIKENDDILYGIIGNIVITLKSDKDECLMYYQIKPYLRPMSSMTEKERDEYTDIKKGECNGCVLTGKGDPDTEFLLVDWLNAHHFDYRGLIEKGLALEAPEDMYK